MGVQGANECLNLQTDLQSGYADHDLEGYKGYDWRALQKATRAVVDAASEVEIWVIFGSVHPLSEGRKPHNSLYVVNDKGKLVDRYDKRFCAGDASEKTGDLAHYTPGSHFCIFEVKGVVSDSWWKLVFGLAPDHDGCSILRRGQSAA